MISSSTVLVAADTVSEYRDKLVAVAAAYGSDPEEMERDDKERNAPHGTWDQVRTILAGMEENGVSRFYLQGRFDPAEIELTLSQLT